MVDSKRILFCNITYMKYYQGITKEDKPVNGGSYIGDTGDAIEKYNFYVRSNGMVFGFVETKYRNGYADGKSKPNTLHIEEINKEGKNKPSLDNVTVVFCAKPAKNKKTVIVGWYENATVYRGREFYSDERLGVQEYNISATPENVYLIDESDRTFVVPRTTDSKDYNMGFGQSNTWYANKRPEQFEFRDKVVDYINAYKANTLSVPDMLEVEDVDEIVNDNINLRESDKQAIVKIRIGQGKFREKLLLRDKKCILCGIQNQNLLISSHIKAWKDCTSPKEKLDIDNGIILCSLHDALFDKGLITFDDNGKILFSDDLSASDRLLTNLSGDCYIKMNNSMKEYMNWHRTHTFKKG